MPQRLFVFVQMEFPWALGPADGRYLLRLREDAEPERVVVIDTLAPPDGRAKGTTAPGVLRRLGSRAVSVPQSPDPAPVSTTRVTVIDPVSLSAQAQARAWLEDLDGEHDGAEAVGVVNRVLYAHRIASADPYVHEVSAGQALVIRAGWGEGEQVASGRWLHARELGGRTRGRGALGLRRSGGRARASALRPQERLAVLLGGRGETLLCEELTLRARQDLDQGRAAHAALELERALEVAVRELGGEGRQDLAIRLAELEQLRARVASEARAALPGSGEQPDPEPIAHALGRLEAALRARTAAGVRLS